MLVAAAAAAAQQQCCHLGLQQLVIAHLCHAAAIRMDMTHRGERGVSWACWLD